MKRRRLFDRIVCLLTGGHQDLNVPGHGRVCVFCGQPGPGRWR